MPIMVCNYKNTIATGGKLAKWLSVECVFSWLQVCFGFFFQFQVLHGGKQRRGHQVHGFSGASLTLEINADSIKPQLECY